MIVSKVEWPMASGIPYVVLTIDTKISYRNVSDIRIVRARVVEWIKTKYDILPVTLGGYSISRGDAIEYITNRHSGTDCYTSRYSSQIKNWIDANNVTRFIIQMNGIWIDPASEKWLAVVECYDPDYANQ